MRLCALAALRFLPDWVAGVSPPYIPFFVFPLVIAIDIVIAIDSCFRSLIDPDFDNDSDIDKNNNVNHNHGARTNQYQKKDPPAGAGGHGIKDPRPGGRGYRTEEPLEERLRETSASAPAATAPPARPL